jgi:hypothetical protein
MNTIKEYLGQALMTVKRDYKGYIIINVLYFVTLSLGMAYALFNPQVQTFLNETLTQSWEESLLASIAQALATENWILALFLIFLANLFLGSIIALTVPSVLVFFAGPLLALFRAVLWGIAFSPTSPQFAAALVNALPVLVLEGEAYCIACMPSLKAGMSWLLPNRAHKQEKLTRKQAFKKALHELALVYVLVALILFISAIVEVAVVYVTGT